LSAAATEAGGGAAEKISEQVDLVFDAEVLWRAAAVLAEDAQAVGVVHHEPGTVAVLELDDLGQRRNVALHREHTVDHDDLALVGRRGGELLGEIFHVVVAVLVAAPEAEAAAVDDARVVEAIEKGDVVALEQARQHTEIDLVAGGEGQHRFAAHELRQALLELYVDVERTVEEARSGTTRAVHGEAGGRGFFYSGVVGEAEVVVGAQHHELLALVDHHGILGRRDHAVVRVGVRCTSLIRPSRVPVALVEDVHPFHLRRSGQIGDAVPALLRPTPHRRLLSVQLTARSRSIRS
jgi:hypothetical protein